MAQRERHVVTSNYEDAQLPMGFLFFLQLFCLAKYNLYFKANKMVVTYGSPHSLTRAL